MHTLAGLESTLGAGGSAALDALLLPIEHGLAALPRIVVDEEESLALRQGKRLVRASAVEQPLCCAVDLQGRPIALVEIVAGGEVRVKRGFN